MRSKKPGLSTASSAYANSMAHPARVAGKSEFGDFQTPDALALRVTRLLHTLGVRPRCIVEPTCGRGSFVAAAAEVFAGAEKIIGLDINEDHLCVARTRLHVDARARSRIGLQRANFFTTDWKHLFEEDCAPWLILGNPPWVTSADLGALDSANLPAKSNFHGRAGIEAITGKSNFDISEWMLLRYLDWIEKRRGTIAVLCKAAVARKVLLFAWSRQLPIRSARIYRIDAVKEFGAAVDACLLVVEIAAPALTAECDVFDDLSASAPSHTFGFCNDILVRDIAGFRRRHRLRGSEPAYTWRSGIKHDCSKVMELERADNGYINGLGERVEIEDAFVYPLFKSSDIANGRHKCRRAMLVPQARVGDDISQLRKVAPKTWSYLTEHGEALDRRASILYRNKPRFSIFGVGPYSFAPWKIAISGFYKQLNFVRIGPIDCRPAVFDDTIYFLPCCSEQEADFLCGLLNSDAVREFYDAMIFWEEKRPITVEVLKRLSIATASTELGLRSQYECFSKELAGDDNRGHQRERTSKQLSLDVG
jgi:predicted RNA methylase